MVRSFRLQRESESWASGGMKGVRWNFIGIKVPSKLGCIPKVLPPGDTQSPDVGKGE